MFEKFHQFATLPRNLSFYFVTLIPKVDSPSLLGDFRPISLVMSIYKILAKVFISKLYNFMDKLIFSNQRAFLK